MGVDNYGETRFEDEVSTVRAFLAQQMRDGVPGALRAYMAMASISITARAGREFNPETAQNAAEWLAERLGDVAKATPEVTPEDDANSLGGHPHDADEGEVEGYVTPPTRVRIRERKKG